jgi:hypothetical protein
MQVSEAVTLKIITRKVLGSNLERGNCLFLIRFSVVSLRPLKNKSRIEFGIGHDFFLPIIMDLSAHLSTSSCSLPPRLAHVNKHRVVKGAVGECRYSSMHLDGGKCLA